MSASLQSLLKETSLEDLTGLQHVTILRDTATVEQALRTLATKRILSAPVITAGPGAHEPGVKWPQEKPLDSNGQLLGFIDVRDVLSSFLLGENLLLGHGKRSSSHVSIPPHQQQCQQHVTYECQGRVRFP